MELQARSSKQRALTFANSTDFDSFCDCDSSVDCGFFVECGLDFCDDCDCDFDDAGGHLYP